MKLIICLFFLSFVCACNGKDAGTGEQQFDKTKWSTMTGADYPYRESMLNDLVYKVTLKGLKKDSVLNLLGQPNRIDSDHLFYTIFQKRMGMFPLKTRTLVIKLNKDSIVEWRKIHG